MNDFIKQRSFEISWALFRVAALFKHPRLKWEVENAAIELLSNPAFATIEKAEKLVKLAEAITEIKSIDAQVLYREFNNLHSAIRQTAEKDAEIGKIFSQPPMVINHKGQNDEIDKMDEKKTISANVEKSENNNIINAAMRQTAILEKIRQLPQCQMKDLIAAFPEVSERTLRNDIQRLSEQGIIERIGNGGPASYYRVKNHENSENLVTSE